MDTYGDMVTLLLTFFIMLYSMSSLSEQKWEIFVRSIYPEDVKEAQEQIDVGGIIDPDAAVEVQILTMTATAFSMKPIMTCALE